MSENNIDIDNMSPGELTPAPDGHYYLPPPLPSGSLSSIGMTPAPDDSYTGLCPCGCGSEFLNGNQIFDYLWDAQKRNDAISQVDPQITPKAYLCPTPQEASAMISSSGRIYFEGHEPLVDDEDCERLRPFDILRTASEGHSFEKSVREVAYAIRSYGEDKAQDDEDLIILEAEIQRNIRAYNAQNELWKFRARKSFDHQVYETRRKMQASLSTREFAYFSNLWAHMGVKDSRPL